MYWHDCWRTVSRSLYNLTVLVSIDCQKIIIIRVNYKISRHIIIIIIIIKTSCIIILNYISIIFITVQIKSINIY